MAHLDEDLLRSVLIVKGGREGTPVTRIELLSPANKPGSSGFERYVEKRDETLRAGLCLVEIDYLHQTRPAIQGIPDYAAREPESYPYFIFGAAYNLTFENGRDYHVVVDYDRLPERFDTYNESDRERIVQRMQAIQEASR